MMVLALAVAAGATATMAWIADRRRGSRRNERGRCAGCGTVWSEACATDPYLLHGRLVCEDCAEAGKRRMVRQFGVIAGATAFAVGAILVKEGLVAMTMLPIASTVVMTVGAVQVMKIANGRAQLRIATGKSSAYAALRPGSEID